MTRIYTMKWLAIVNIRGPLENIPVIVETHDRDWEENDACQLPYMIDQACEQFSLRPDKTVDLICYIPLQKDRGFWKIPDVFIPIDQYHFKSQSSFKVATI